MQPDATYSIVRHLQLAGQWSLALDVLADSDPNKRAELIAERAFWQGVPADLDLVNAADPETALVMRARISYHHRLFKLEGGENLDEASIFAAAPGGWAAFWHGVVQDNIHEDVDKANASYARALQLTPDDPLLESYVVRHQGANLMESDPQRGLSLLRRSLNLRAGLGARPQVAAAQLTLAHFLGEHNPEAEELREIGLATAAELGLKWLLRNDDE